MALQVITTAGVPVVVDDKKVVDYGEWTLGPTAPQRQPVTSPDVARDKALAYVNTARHALGFEALDGLPKGLVRSTSACVLAMALPHVSLVGSWISFMDSNAAHRVATVWGVKANGISVPTPAALMDFIQHFDSNRYPDLSIL